MKGLLIKIGKVWKTIQEDGIFSGSRRIFVFFWNFVKTILRRKKGDILIITGGVGDSARFRAVHVSEELNLHGFKCDYTLQDDLLLSQYVDEFKIFIFHRVLFTEKISNLIFAIKKQGKEIIFDTDDLVFDSKLFHQTETFKQFNLLEKNQYQRGAGQEILNDFHVKVCTTTTSFLAEKLRQHKKKVFIVPNKLSMDDLKIVKEMEKKRKKSKISNPNSQITLGYFRGSAGHDRDFATITKPLIKILKKYPQIKLFIAGKLKLEKEFKKFKKQIILSPYVPRKKHFRNVSRCDIILAPLVKDDPFCESKSELKFFESGALKIPTVAVRNQTFSKAISDEVNGFLADNENEWFEKIEKLVLDEKLREKMGEQAREKVLASYLTRYATNEEYYSYLKSKL